MDYVIDVSICHCGEDRAVAAKIAKGLRRRGINVWLDPESLVVGLTSVMSIEEAAARSKIILYLCSPATLKAQWVKTEQVKLFHKEGIQKDLTLIPVKVSPCELPLRLKNRVGVDLTEGNFEEHLDKLAKGLQQILKKRLVFICHSSQDKSHVRKVVAELKKESFISLWYDEDSLKPGSIIRRGIESGIVNADYLLAIISRNTIDTIQGWIGFELDQAYEIERTRNQLNHYFAIPVIIERGVKVPGWLGTKVYVDLSKDFSKGIGAIIEAVKVAPPVQNSS